MVAVETLEGQPIHIQLRCVDGFTKDAIRDYAKANIQPGSRVLSDGLGCWNGFKDADLQHEPRVTGGGRPRTGEFKWVNTALGNIKSAIVGTCRSCDIQHTARYLAAYEWRYNRRFDLDQNLSRLAPVAVTTSPQPYRKLASIRPKAAEILG